MSRKSLDGRRARPADPSVFQSWAHEMVLYVDVIDIRVVPDSPELSNARNVGSGLVAGTLVLLANGELRPVDELTWDEMSACGPLGGPHQSGASSHVCRVSKRI